MSRGEWRFAPAPFLVAGPCVAEEGDFLPRVAERLARIGERVGIRVCFKASFDKANRSRLRAPRGPGLERGLALLEAARQASGLAILTDVHEPEQAAPVAEVADVLQVPAFLCRQTDLLVACGRTGKPVNVKKGQWMAADAMRGAIEKVRSGGTTEVAVTERGTFFGYGDLVVDFRNVARLRAATGKETAVIVDATHSAQRPGQGPDGASAGRRDEIPTLLAAAAAARVDGFYVETHPDPARAPSDAATQWPLDGLEPLLQRTLAIWHAAGAPA